VLHALKASRTGAGLTIDADEARRYETVAPKRWPPTEAVDRPLTLHESQVRPEWIDYNGHMTTVAYDAAFDEALESFLRYIGADDLFEGATVEGPVVIFDDEGYYLAATLAEMLRASDIEVVLATPEGRVASWMTYTTELVPMNRRLLGSGVRIITNRYLSKIENGSTELTCVFGSGSTKMTVKTVVMVTMPECSSEVFDELIADPHGLESTGIQSVKRIGDCVAPGIIAEAVYAGHRYAREFDSPETDGWRTRIERTELDFA